MANLLTGLVCANTARNTGTNLCVANFGDVKGIIMVPAGVSYTPTQTATGAAFLAALQASAKNVNKALRIYPIIMGQGGVELANVDATTESSGYGDIRTLLDAKTGITMSFWGMGPCWNANAMSFNRQESSWRAFLVDADGTVAGTVLPNGNMTGYRLSRFYVSQRTLAVGTAGEVITINIQLQDGYNEFGKNWAYVKTDNAYTSLTGLNDIYLKNITSTVTPTPAAGTYYIQVLASCGGASAAAIYSTAFGSTTQGSPFSITNPATSNDITMLTNTYNTTYDAMQIGLDTSDTDYNAATNIMVALGNVSVLDGLNIIGLEAVPNSITFAK